MQHRGFEVSADVTQTEKEFTNLVRSNSYDVILADYNLPSWNGMESVAILGREGLDILVIVVSGALGELTAVECIKQGAADYVLKDGGATSSPIRGKILIRWVEACAGSFIRTARFKNRRAMGPLPRKYRGRIQIVP